MTRDLLAFLQNLSEGNRREIAERREALQGQPNRQVSWASSLRPIGCDQRTDVTPVRWALHVRPGENAVELQQRTAQQGNLSLRKKGTVFGVGRLRSSIMF